MSRQFNLTILGSNSARPAFGRFPTSQVLNVNNHSFLLDCGEGAQMRIAQYKIKLHKISHVFISHLHGDHIFGLPGLITSMTMHSRIDPLIVFGPVGIKEYLETVLRISCCHLVFKLVIKEIDFDQDTTILDLDDVTVSAFPVFHRIPTFGYIIREKQSQKNIHKEAIQKYNLSIEQIKNIKAGNDLEVEGKIIPNEELTKKAASPLSYAFCADSRAEEALIPILEGVTVMYFETTYLDELADKAIERGHATAKQAADLAKASKVSNLITGHYSSRYKDVTPFFDEANLYFDNVFLGYDGLMIDFTHLNEFNA